MPTFCNLPMPTCFPLASPTHCTPHPAIPLKAALLGLDHIIPVLTPELLAAPSLGAALFSLLAYLAELFPDHVAGLPGPSFQRLVPLLEFGLQHPEQEVLQQCLEAVAALAGWHVTVTGFCDFKDEGLGLENMAG